MKTFIFGRRDSDPKGPKEEHGEVRVEAPSIDKAREAFAEKHGDKDARASIVRVDAVSVPSPSPTAKRVRKAKA